MIVGRDPWGVACWLRKASLCLHDLLSLELHNYELWHLDQQGMHDLRSLGQQVLLS
jgi:hypothetical protein